MTASPWLVRASLSILFTIRGASALAQRCGEMQDLGTLLLVPNSQALGVSDDGSVVVGWTSTANGQTYHAFRWTAPGGMHDLGTLGGTQSAATGVSADGSVVVGQARTADGNYHAFRWTLTEGMQDLGTLGGPTSYAEGVSADGSVVVGMSSPPGGLARAFRWTAAGGMQNLGTLGGTAWSWANGVAADGSVVVGEANGAAGSRAFRWTATGGMQDLGTLDGTGAQALDVSGDGSVVVGRAYLADGRYRAFRWIAAEGMQDLGTGDPSDAYGVSADGSVVVGTAFNSSRGFRWTATDGMQDLGTLGGVSSAAYAVSPDGSIVVGYSDVAGNSASHAFRWGHGPELLFRESCDGSWTFGPEQIPGWDHVGLFTHDRVYESHPGYGCHFGCMQGTPDCSGMYWDPECDWHVGIAQVDGVQWQHTRGSFRHDSTTLDSTAANLSVPIPGHIAAEMATFIETQDSAPFLSSNCGSALNFSCIRDQFYPDRQKGYVDGQYTCVGLIERAAEQGARLNGGEGFIPNSRESFPVPFFGRMPILSPWLLSQYAENGFDTTLAGFLAGMFDPVDFMLIDPAGRRLGHTVALGTINEIPGAFFTGNGALEQFLIPNPMPGQYQLQLVGIGGRAGAAVGGVMEGRMFEDTLAIDESHDINFFVPCPGDTNGDGAIDQTDLAVVLARLGTQDDATREYGDHDCDFDVDMHDFARFQLNFGSVCP